MNREKLFGLKTGFISDAGSSLLKQGILLRHKINKNHPIPLTYDKSEIVKNLKLLRAGEGPKPASGLLIGTVRMGYGHHRMALSAYSWALLKTKDVFLHDLLAIESPEASAIREIDSLYSYFSRLSSEIPGPLEWAWGYITSQGNVNSLVLSTMLAEEYKNLMSDLPTGLPVISSYPMNGQIAVACGFQKVVHLVPDNYPQYFLLVPGAMNLVQSQAAYMQFLKMGIPKENLAVAGHWVSSDIVENIKRDSNARIKRAEKKKKRRLLLAIGGAGAQKNYILELLKSLGDKLRNKEIHLLINTGDHKEIFHSIKEKLDKEKVDYEVIRDWDSVIKFCNTFDLSAWIDAKEETPVTIFHFGNYFEAFTATDKLIRVSDLLITKPSELAFFQIPKVFIRRVGDHEAASAFRSVELGDGTTECREPAHAIDLINLLTEQKELFIRMNESVLRNSQDGIYSGSKYAVELAMNMK
ncbi:MAG: hypothetical protein K8R21_02370 [Leptospira sp.]|nr:hypothetical protein [Leptospira sp.]